MEIEIKSRTIEFAAKILEDIFSEDAPNLAVEISAHKEKGVALSALLNAIDDVRHAMATEADRPILRTVKLEISPDLRLATAATDGRRLAFVERKLGITTSLPADGGSFEVELSAAAVRFILSAPHGDRTSIFLMEYARVKILTGGSSAIFTAPGGFPKWREAFPPCVTEVATLPCQDTAEALYSLFGFRGFRLLDDPTTAPTVEVLRTKTAVEIIRVEDSREYSPDDFVAKFDAPETQLPDFRVRINAKYLYDAITERSGNVHIFWPKHPVLSFKPMVLRFDDAAINEVIAPMREP